MLLHITSFLPFLFLIAKAHDDHDAPTHGEGEEGSSMGPVAFMWPQDRHWSAADDNVAPCGSGSGPTDRTVFPLTQGSVALNIADEAWHVAFRIAYEDNPTRQADFENQVVNNITELEPGHMCYKLNQLEGVPVGTNATIQLEYWSDFEGENNGRNQSFFACADVTFVEAKDFTEQVPCFNVTSDDFNAPIPSSRPVSTLPGSSDSDQTSSGATSDGLSGGAKAGIAVGAIVGGLLLFSAIAFYLYRKGKLIGMRKKGVYEMRANNLHASENVEPKTAV